METKNKKFSRLEKNKFSDIRVKIFKNSNKT